MRRVSCLCLAAVLPWTLWADEDSSAALKQVQQRVQVHLESIGADQVTRSPAPGLYEVQDGMAFAYVTGDGRYLVQGDLIDLETGVVLTEQRRNQYRAQRVGELASTGIEFAPIDRAERQRVHVFIDVDCRYCTDLHREVPALNREGVAVSYLFYPRRGEQSEGFELAQKAWCAEDQRKALTQLFEGASMDKPAGCADPVAEHLAVALDLGVRGTPMIVLPDGGIHYGYLEADDLLQQLEAFDAQSDESARPTKRRPGPPK